MSDDGHISRRDLLRGRLGRGGSGPGRDARGGAERGGAATIVHRPPGAVAEPEFLAGCTRCGECITACPVDAIFNAGPRHGSAAGTPIIDAMKAPCVMCEDTPCITACEPGVLRTDVPIKMGTASIRVPTCLAHQGTTCTVCSEQCPVDGAIEVSRGKPTVNAGNCTGCGVCQHVCPAPYNAVVILPADRAPAPPPGAGVPGAAPPAFDWRRAYFADRRLRPPSADAPDAPEEPEFPIE